jgi:hypothetical protein
MVVTVDETGDQQLVRRIDELDVLCVYRTRRPQIANRITLDHDVERFDRERMGAKYAPTLND